MSDKAIIKRAVEHYGDRAQTIKAVEELAELQKALCKYLGGCGFAEHISGRALYRKRYEPSRESTERERRRHGGKV